MALILFSGAPKTGKTLLVVTRLYVLLKKGLDRPLFADIAGLKIEGVQPPPDDWTTLPDGSLVIYDEIQRRKAYKKARGDSPHHFIHELAMHAHRGFDIWIISQHPSRIHHDVLDYVTDHYHTRRPNNVNFSMYYYWDEHKKSPSGVSARRDYISKGIVRHNKEMFDLYDSTQVDDETSHHKKFELSNFGKAKIAFMLLLAYIVFSPFFSSDEEKPVKQQQPKQQAKISEKLEQNQTDLKKELGGIQNLSNQPQPQPQPQQELEQQIQSVQVFNPVTQDYFDDVNLAPVSVLSFKNKCRLYNKNSQPLLNYSYDECMLYANDSSLLAKIN